MSRTAWGIDEITSPVETIVVMVSSKKAMHNIADELGKPMLRMDGKGKVKYVFYAIDGNTVYKYIEMK